MVVTVDADDVIFTTSPALTAHMDLRALKATVQSLDVTPAATHRIRVYRISEVLGFPSFVNRRDLEVCYDTVPAGAGKRCVQIHFGVPPFHLRLSVDGGLFQSSAVARTMPYQTSRVVVRVRDVNALDRVCIDLPATYGQVSGVPGTDGVIVEDAAERAYFEWEDSGECYAATRCASGLVGGELCAGGEWERVFTIKSKTRNTTLTFGSEPQSAQVKSASRWSAFTDQSSESAQLSLNPVLGVPAFVDSLPGANMVAGTPYSMQRLDTCFINCPMSTVSMYSLLQIWTGAQGSYSYSTSEAVEILPQGELPGGSVLSYPPDLLLPRYNQRFAGNFHLQGRIASVEIDWTPSKGQEGRDHTLCFTARGKVSGKTNVRCFVVPVARCQYCTIEGDSLQSLSVDYKTSWLQLWSANAVCCECLCVRENAIVCVCVHVFVGSVAVGDI